MTRAPVRVARGALSGLFFVIYGLFALPFALLLPVLPLFFCAFGLTVAGVILGIRDDNAEKPVREEKMLRSLGCMRDRAVHQQADRKTLILRTAVLVIALILITIGILNGGLEDVLAKGASICTECVGLG